MPKLWEKGYDLDSLIEEFTVGEDYLVDMKLIKYDVKASIVHAEMLEKMGYLERHEFIKIKEALEELLTLVESGKFCIDPEEEDSHTAIENFLVQKLGEAGKKIHTARSRNDQVLTALRLLYKDELKDVCRHLKGLRSVLRNFAKKYGHIKFAGFTHTRKAMPANFRMWGMALCDALKDDEIMINLAIRLIDQSPLGTGAGYGVPIKIDRNYIANRLGFSKVQRNPIYSQNSRAKFDYLILHCLSQVSYDLNRFASDIIFFSLPDIGYLIIPENLCTGSSIMPQKMNPDPVELVRAYHSRIISKALESALISMNLISGYHRDMQLLKITVLETFKDIKDMLRVTCRIFEKIQVNGNKCKESLTEEVMATQEVYRLLMEKGMSFRDAYRVVAEKYGSDRE